MEGASEKKVSREWATPSPSPGDTSIGSRHPHPSAQTLGVFLNSSIPPPPPQLAASHPMPVLSPQPRPCPATHTLMAALAGPARRGTELVPIPHASQTVSLTTTHSRSTAWVCHPPRPLLTLGHTHLGATSLTCRPPSGSLSSSVSVTDRWPRLRSLWQPRVYEWI